MNPLHEYARYEMCRQFLSRGSNAMSWPASAASRPRGLAPSAHAAGIEPSPTGSHPLAGRLHFAPKAKHVIYLHMVGGPPQMDLYDYKPKMNDCYDKDLPDSIRMGQRLTTMTSRPGAVPDRAVEIQVRPARQVRHVGQRAAAVHGQDGR